MIKTIVIISMIVCYAYNVKSQNLLQLQEDSVIQQFEKIILTDDDSDKKYYNKNTVEIFERALKNEDAFDYSFEKLKYIGCLNSKDKNVRIFTWNLAYSDGTYEYFGFVVYFPKSIDNQLVYRLNDKSAECSSPTTQSLTNSNWFGALYYQIIENKFNKKTYYTLLGWDGNTDFTNKKVIEVLTFDDENTPQFWLPIFNVGETKKKRLVFEYAERAKMTLKWDDDLDLIIFDYLSPPKPIYDGQYEYYGPDGTYGGLYFKDGLWHYQSDVDARNVEEKK